LLLRKKKLSCTTLGMEQNAQRQGTKLKKPKVNVDKIPANTSQLACERGSAGHI
jgi:hypothetical protein